MIRRIAHACFAVRNLEDAAGFYLDKLGMTPAFDFIGDDGVRFGAYIHAGGGTFIELFAGQPEAEAGGSFQHICLQVDDIDAAVVGLRNKGLEVSDPVLGEDGTWQAWLSDPDGNRIELHAYTPGSRQGPWVGES